MKYFGDLMSKNQVECGSELIFITICQYIPNIVGITSSYLTYLKLPLVATLLITLIKIFSSLS